MSADQQGRDRTLAEQAYEREQLRALLRTAEHPGRYRVVRQLPDKGELIELSVCAHRWEWLAEVCAYRHVMRHRTAAGGHYTVRRAGL